MISSEGPRGANGTPAVATSPIVWNTLVPALGLALILGAPVLPAVALAAVAAIAIHGLLAARSTAPAAT